MSCLLLRPSRILWHLQKPCKSKGVQNYIHQMSMWFCTKAEDFTAEIHSSKCMLLKLRLFGLLWICCPNKLYNKSTTKRKLYNKSTTCWHVDKSRRAKKNSTCNTNQQKNSVIMSWYSGRLPVHLLVKLVTCCSLNLHFGAVMLLYFVTDFLGIHYTVLFCYVTWIYKFTLDSL